ncbi:mannitol dehydrogenase family protein [uncultured Cohaesibacter sp.]|uniref:mannitol dehydrogenase family protein n=1 Tax=uncultured Cohaesibacter sp. TaxID=1002546 RepID=UPI0029C7550D|nr:mannitol dehydrogenase family protein [uncultured Cohaesibacter sp.]
MDELIPLQDATLNKMPDMVKVPDYDRSKLSAGILHIGLGNFHRAHQAWYLHKLLEKGLARDWAIVGAGVRSNDAEQRARLLEQDCLTTLIELDPSGKSAEITGSMIEFVPVEDGNAALIDRMACPDIRIVSLTVTEGGYYIDPATGQFASEHPDIVHDAQHPDRPRTAFGAMIAALKRRREQGIGPFTGQCCDNLQGNGAILRRTILSLARLSDPELADWIDAHCSFPNSMVDCIVPATGDKEIELVQSFGIDDAAPVTHENFRQWVIEDDFCAGRPDWDKVGATFSDGVHQYETMKLRILNGGHQLISISGSLLGVDTIADCMEHQDIRGFLHKTMTREVLPNVSPVPGVTPEAYLDLIARRFSNREIIDTTRRVAFDGSSRQPGFIIPSIRDALAKGMAIEGLALMSALWMRYCLGRREDGSAIEPNDPNWQSLRATAEKAEDAPRLWMEQREYYGDLADSRHFANAFELWAGRLKEAGVLESLRSFNR